MAFGHFTDKMSLAAASNPVKPHSQYQYSALADDSIRLIRISPGESSNPIRCAIIRKRLQDLPEYDALSYAWGSNAKTQRIYVEPLDPSFSVTTMSVTSSCFQLLLHLRNMSFSVGEVWIDALCINQENDAEKSEQIKRMGEIFKGAKRVLVYPGEIFPNNTQEIAALRTYLKVQHEDFPFTLPIPVTTIQRILNKKWFWRTWVLQEVLLARHVEIILGTGTSPWTEFTQAANKAIPFILEQGPATRVFFRSPPILQLTKSIYGDSNFDLHDLLKRTRHLQASDSRDKIYALLGISVPNPRYDTLVQYGKATFREIYAAFARAFIAQSGKLDILTSSAQILLGDLTDFNPVERRVDSALKASWAPDWSVRPLQELKPSIAEINVFNANAGLQAFVENTARDLKYRCQDNTGLWNVLTVRGRRLGCVKFPTFTTPDGPTRQIWFGYNEDGGYDRKREGKTSSKCRRACTVAGNCSKYPEETPENVCFRTFYFHLPIELDSIEIENMSREFWRKIDKDQDEEDFWARDIDSTGLLGICKGERIPFHDNIYGREICTTDNGYFGLVPSHARDGDLVCCLAGGSVPYVLRQSENGNDFKLVGECYIHGVMQGEALQGAQLEDLEVFELS